MYINGLESSATNILIYATCDWFYTGGSVCRVVSSLKVWGRSSEGEKYHILQFFPEICTIIMFFSRHCGGGGGGNGPLPSPAKYGP